MSIPRLCGNCVYDRYSGNEYWCFDITRKPFTTVAFFLAVRVYFEVLYLRAYASKYNTMPQYFNS